MAAIDLCQLSDLKSWLTITSTNNDSILARLITSGSNAFLSRLKRNPNQSIPGTYTLYEQTIIESYDGHGGNVLVLRCYPVQVILSVTVNPQIGPYWAWPISQLPQPIIIPQSNGITPGWSFEPNDIRILKMVGGYVFGCGNNNVQVQYTAGYPVDATWETSPPFDIQQAVIELCAKKFRSRDAAIGQDSASMSSVQTLRFSPKDFTPEVWAVINDYRDRVPK